MTSVHADVGEDPGHLTGTPATQLDGRAERAA